MFYLVIFIEGIISISLEITTMRVLMPYYGSSIIVTSLVIGIFLLFLSIGYYYGGKTKTNPLKNLFLNIFIVYFLTLLFLNDAAVSMLFHNVNGFFFSLSLYLMVFLAPAIFLLGQSMPLLISFFDKEKINEISGKMLFLSTIGSFIGSIGLSLLAFQYLGVNTSVYLILLLIFMITFVLAHKFNSKIITSLIIISLTSVAIYLMPIKKYSVNNAYSNIEVIKNDKDNQLFVNNNLSSLIDNEKKAYGYINDIFNIMYYFYNTRNKDILVIGAGGCSLGFGDEENKYTFVDIDKQLKKVIEEEFLEDEINGEFIGMEGSQFLNENKKKFDVILLDTFSSRNTIPVNMISLETLSNINNTLTDKGMFYMNTLQKPFIPNDYSTKLQNTVYSAFGYCNKVMLAKWDVNNADKLSNVVYICFKKKKSMTELYTNDLNQASIDYFNSTINDEKEKNIQ
jgi:spermidine synthase